MEPGGEIPDIPARPDERQGPRVGVDEWVARVDDPRAGGGLPGAFRRAVERVPPWARFAVFIAFAASAPLWMTDAELFDYGIFTLIFVLLGLGLNLVVGYAGLLDLGYVAFFGFGAYGYGI